MNMKRWSGILVAGLCVSAQGNERLFNYTYEPETMPAGAAEFEQWVTLRSQRNKTVGQDNYNRWELREELEYGVTDNYTISLYLNFMSESFRDPVSGTDHKSFAFTGVSLENKYLVLNPAEHAVGLSLYLEPTFGGDAAELEEKIILGQRHGKWKWALNLTHATEWADNFHATEGEIEVSFGLARQMNKRWAVGLELRDHNEMPGYKKWENTVLYFGPVVNYRTERWWTTLTVMPQIYGHNFGPDPDGNSHLELEGHERVNVRFIVGFEF